MTKSGRQVRFEIDADCKGEFHTDFDSPVIDLPTTAPLLNATNSRLLVGTGNCDTMTVRFDELSIIYTKSEKQNGSAAAPPQLQKPRGKEGAPMN